MKFKIKKNLLSWEIVDEKGKVVAKIKNKKMLGKEKNIMDLGDHIIFTTDIINLPVQKENWNSAENKQYVVFHEQEEIATATFHYAKDPERTLLQKIVLKSPQIDEMNVETPYGVWCIKRLKDGSITINERGRIIGTISSFLSFKKQYIETLGDFEPAFLAGIYILAVYMMQEENLINV